MSHILDILTKSEVGDFLMQRRRWKFGFFVVFLILVATLSYQWMQPGAFDFEQEELSVNAKEHDGDNLQAYFPNWSGVTYRYSGEGMEFSSFSRKISFARDGLIQIEDESGTNLVQVVESSDHEIKVVWVEEEFYDGVSILNPESRSERENGRAVNLILLKAPLKEGTTWSDERFEREIRSIDQVMETPLGTIYDVIVVKNRSKDAENFVQYEYYAKNVGLIKRETIQILNGETYGTVSTLHDLIVQK